MKDGEFQITCFGAPTQVEGVHRGVYVYFRERYGQWTFSIATEWELKCVAGAHCEEFMDPIKALALAKALADVYVP